MNMQLIRSQQMERIRSDNQDLCIRPLGDKITTNAPQFEVEELALFFDVPSSWLGKVIAKSFMKPTPHTKIPSHFKNQLELYMYRESVEGLKWVAIRYGISDGSLIQILEYITSSHLATRQDAHQILNEYNKFGVINSNATKFVLDHFLQSQGNVIFTSLHDRTEYLLNELCAPLQLSVTTVFDYQSFWLNSVRATSKKSKSMCEDIIASSFCSYTGLPISISRSEYLSALKPAVLEPDRVSWAAIATYGHLDDMVNWI